jgi:hypothetical protein
LPPLGSSDDIAIVGLISLESSKRQEG